MTDYPEPSAAAADAAARIETGLPEEVERQAIEIAARAYDMGAVETFVVGAITDQNALSTESRNRIRAEQAAFEVRNYLLEANVPRLTKEMLEANWDTIAVPLLNAGREIAVDRIEVRM